MYRQDGLIFYFSLIKPYYLPPAVDILSSQEPSTLNTTGASPDHCRAARGLRRLLAEGQGVRRQEQDETSASDREDSAAAPAQSKQNKIQKGSPKEAF